MFQGDDISLPKSPFRKAPKEVGFAWEAVSLDPYNWTTQIVFQISVNFFLQTVAISIETFLNEIEQFHLTQHKAHIGISVLIYRGC
jgi:hypothetical protein